MSKPTQIARVDSALSSPPNAPASATPQGTRPAGFLTRKDVAEQLRVSISTVRRMEGSELTPVIGTNGVRYFDPAAIGELADATPAPRRGKNAGQMSAGELAAAVFTLFEQRYGISEIVMGLQVEPAKVRNLYDEWRACLEREAMDRADYLPALYLQGDQDGPAKVNETTCAKLLSLLPEGAATRISLAQFEGDEQTKNGVLHSLYAERFGFVTHGPVTLQELAARYGAGQVRITAIDCATTQIQWEVFADLPRPSY